VREVDGRQQRSSAVIDAELMDLTREDAGEELTGDESG